jgi:hypothetical protein
VILIKNSIADIKFASAVEAEHTVAPRQFSYSATTSRYQTLVKDWHKCNEERWILLTWISLLTSGKMKQITQIIIIIIIIRHQLGIDRHVSASSSSLFKDLPNRLRPFGL